jgi:hypothetical protein
MKSEHVHIALAVLAGILIDRYVLGYVIGLGSKVLHPSAANNAGA